MGERILHGIGAAPGVVAGNAVVLDGDGSATDKPIEPENRQQELTRAFRALDAEVISLEQIVSRLRERGRTDEADIVETGVLMAQDPGLRDCVEKLVIEAGRSAPSALKAAARESAEALAALPDPMLAQRADDVRSLGRRAAAHAMGTTLIPGGVLIAANLGPADVADLGLNATGAALAGGGITAHAAIVARSLGVPMVVGLGPEALSIANGEKLVLDGDQGLLILSPSASRLAGAQETSSRRGRARDVARARRSEPAVTSDGRRVTVLTNAATAAETIEGFEQGAEGIGLLRTELPFLEEAEWPSEIRQADVLRGILTRVAVGKTTIRLFDFGGDKTPPFLRGSQTRGIDLLLSVPGALMTQLAAIAAAGHGAQMRVLVPMVARPAQVLAVRDSLTRAFGDRTRPLLGAMIETPDAALHAAEIAKVVDFFSIGTNDLTQLVLGFDREHSKTSPITHPDVLRLIDLTIRAGHAQGIPIDVCGEAASDPVAMPLLVGLGVDELSAAAARVGEGRERIRGLNLVECQAAAKAALVGQGPHAVR